MADSGHLRVAADDSLRSGFGPGERPGGSHARTHRFAVPKSPTSDIGTVFLHWTAAIACLVTLFTGLRIAADAEGSVVAAALSPILPQGEIWSWHVGAGLTLFFVSSAYLIYMRRSGLKRRAALGKIRALALPASRKIKWGAVNVILHWLLYASLTVLTATGVALYLGYGGWVVVVHSTTAFGVLGYIACHLICHYGYGGFKQLLRIFRPSKLVVTRATQPRPILYGSAGGIAIVLALVAMDVWTRDQLVVRNVTQPPVVDGYLDDAVWAASPRVSIRTHQGSNLDGAGASTVEVMAAKAAGNIYFAFRWQDPTRSLKRLPLIKKDDGWHLMHNWADIADETSFYEDKIAVLFTRTASFGNGGTTHLGPQPLTGRPGALNKRGLHYTTDNSIADVWQWKASRGGHLGRVDDMHFGPPLPANANQMRGTARYSAGYDSDPGKAFYVYNYATEPPGGFRGPVKVSRLPKDWEAMQAKLGTVRMTPNAFDDEGSQWWLFESESVPYSPEVDARIPVGTVMPSTLIMGTYEGDRSDLKGAARWRDGHWHLEVTRKLKATGKYDTAFEGELYLWVAVFDNNQTRHTRHQRPVRLRFQ
ncbi:MAG: ethylbenzene dehydrogenase-related protein [Xanthobacteraceae bacterium]